MLKKLINSIGILLLLVLPSKLEAQIVIIPPSTAADVDYPIPIGAGGTGSDLVDPGADRILFWDDSADEVTWLTPGAGIVITSTIMTVGDIPAPIVIISSGTTGTYSADNSGFFIKNANGDELLRLWASDPDSNNYNDGNLYLGYHAGLTQPSDNINAGYENTVMGYNAFIAVTIGNRNSVFGANALQASTGNSNFNAAFGAVAGAQTISGSRNSFFGGFQTGIFNETGNDHVAVGYQAGPTTAALSNTITVGSGAMASASNRGVFGNSSVIDFYFGSESATSLLHSNGLSVSNGAALKTDTTTGHTMLISGYDVNATSYIPFITITNSNTPSFVIAPSGDGTVSFQGTYKSNDGSDGATGTCLALPVVKNGLVISCGI